MLWGEPSKDELKRELRVLYSIFQDDIRCPSMDSKVPRALGIKRISADRGTAVDSAQKCFNVLHQLANGKSHDGSLRHSCNYRRNIEIALSNLLESMKFTLAAPHWSGRVDNDKSQIVDEYILFYWEMMQELMYALVFCDGKQFDKKVIEVSSRMDAARKGINVLLEQDYDKDSDSDY
jgi:hypothetical protein